ncbi:MULTISPECIES: hypothetical protein [unclassified Cetobacterium]|uniref:hypothetical protein n=1 Tax=unclassified Cetobacterium TaxID=2630983 RepID=UPI000646AF40|nr:MULTISPECIES: hypothetical protein [unclassified Cetobacterium]
MNRTLKVTLSIFCGLSILAGIFYATKENPRVYLSDRINLAYVNEDINHKDFENLIELLNKADFNVDDSMKEGLKYIKGLYILSDSSFISDKKTAVGIVDFGYLYPLMKFRVETYFDKADDMYLLKEEYKKKYFNGERLYLKIEKGNFLVATREKDIEKALKSERYFNQNIIKILDRENNNNLGMLILNLGKNPLGGFDELVLTGDVNLKNEVILTANIGGKNDIIKSFNGIEDDNLSGDRVVEKNKLYLRSSRDAELRSFLFFLNYFFRNSFIDGVASKVNINVPKDDKRLESLPKENLIDVNISSKQFIYSYLDIKIKDKEIGKVELKGLAQDNRLKISTTLDEETTLNLLKAVK